MNAKSRNYQWNIDLFVFCDHRPPHIHAIYNEFEILIVIETGNIYAGNMPNKQLKQVYD